MFDIARLSSPHREAMVVHEIRFYTEYPVGASDPTSDDVKGHVNLGYEVRATIHVGQMLLAETVPVWSFAPICDRFMESIEQLSGCFRWRLLKPLFVPPGMGFRVSVNRSLVANVLATYTDPINTWCSILGQTVNGNFPRTMNVPFASSYAPTPKTSGRFTASQHHLVNNTRSRIDMKYAIGRLPFIFAATGTPVAETWDVQDAGIDVSAKCAFGCNTIKIVPAGTEFNSAFDYARRTLRLADFPLNPGDAFSFWMDYPVGTPAEWSSRPPSYWAPNITVVGLRQEVVP
jgi:hypothetical protein